MNQTERNEKILVINPGGTSTKIAVYHGQKQVFVENVRHAAETARFSTIYGQLDWRLEMTRQCLERHGMSPSEFGAVVGRGGALAPVPSGVFAVDDAMIDAIREGRVFVQHASLLGAPMARAIAAESSCPAYIVDPVCVDEMLPEAKMSGLPQLPFRAVSHVLSVKAASRRAAAQMGRKLDEINLIVAHLGSGFTISAERKGQGIDHNDASSYGPIAPTRSGTLPTLDFARYCFSGEKSFEEVELSLVGKGGWVAHLGTDDVREVYARIDKGDAQARLVLDATLHTVSKEIGGLFSVLRGKVDAIVLTGGVAHSARFIEELEERIAWIGAPFIVFPGEDEMLALAEGALRALRGESEAISMAPYLLSAGMR